MTQGSSQDPAQVREGTKQETLCKNSQVHPHASEVHLLVDADYTIHSAKSEACLKWRDVSGEARISSQM